MDARLLIPFVIYSFPVAAFSYILYRFFWKREKVNVNRYKLFKVRDDLVFLVATGRLREGDYLYEQFYGLVNQAIHQIQHFRLKEITKITLDQKQQLEAVQTARQIEEHLAEAHPEVKRVIALFFITMIGILIDNSLSLKITMRHRWVFKGVRFIMNNIRMTKQAFAPQVNAYSSYKTYDGYAAKLSTA